MCTRTKHETQTSQRKPAKRTQDLAHGHAFLFCFGFPIYYSSYLGCGGGVRSLTEPPPAPTRVRDFPGGASDSQQDKDNTHAPSRFDPNFACSLSISVSTATTARQGGEERRRKLVGLSVPLLPSSPFPPHPALLLLLTLVHTCVHTLYLASSPSVAAYIDCKAIRTDLTDPCAFSLTSTPTTSTHWEGTRHAKEAQPHTELP